MKRTIKEEIVLFSSVLKWILLASFIGLIVGVGVSIFLSILSWAIDVGEKYNYTFLLLPFAFFISSYLTVYFAPDARGHSMEKVIEAIHKHGSIIPAAVIPVKLLATVITIATGGSAGKAGPCGQIGAGMASLFARLFRLEENDRKKLVICGISAGFATVFGAPIAGSIFGVEVLIVGSLLYDMLLPSFVAGLTAYQVSSYFELFYLHSPVALSGLEETLLLKVMVGAILFGFVSVLLIQGMREAQRFFGRFNIWLPLKAAGAGALLAFLAIIFGRECLGLGLNTISYCLHGGSVYWFLPFLKILFTSITLHGGGSGGIVMPILFVGSTAGAILGPVLNVDPPVMSAIGFVCLLAGAANTPIAASIMAVEMFGPSIGPYAAVGCVVTYLITGYRSVYPSQVLAIRKSSSLEAQIGEEIHLAKPSYRHREKTIVGIFTSLWRSKGRSG